MIAAVRTVRPVVVAVALMLAMLAGAGINPAAVSAAES